MVVWLCEHCDRIVAMTPDGWIARPGVQHDGTHEGTPRHVLGPPDDTDAAMALAEWFGTAPAVTLDDVRQEFPHVALDPEASDTP